MPGRPSKVFKPPRCTALLRDGSKCQTVSVVDGLCEHHYDAQATAQPTPEPLPEPVELELPEVAKEALKLAPGQVRGQLATDLAGGYYKVIRALTEAMDGEKTHSVQCRKCGTFTAVQVADHRVRLEATKAWVEMGLGKTAQAAEPKPLEIPPYTDVSKMSRAERKTLLREVEARIHEMKNRPGVSSLALPE